VVHLFGLSPLGDIAAGQISRRSTAAPPAELEALAAAPVKTSRLEPISG
jgi:hypothetical protein